MEKLDNTDLSQLMKDVRSSYRMLALYQKRLLDFVNYIGNQYGLDFERGGSQFSNAGGNGKNLSLDHSGWNWLVFYFYSFKFTPKKIGENIFRFRIIHQADTGYYDVENSDLSKLDIDNFNSVENSKTRLFLLLCKNDESFPMQNFLPPHASQKSHGIIKDGNWLGASYGIEQFLNRESTDKILKQFSEEAKTYFNIEILKKGEVVS